MTAIIAYAEQDYAFVAGDSKRVLGLYPTVKLHTWGSQVVFAQSGNATHLSKCIGMMCAFRGSMWGTDLADFHTAFSSQQPIWHAQAVSARATNPSIDTNGVLLVADAASGMVTKFEFGTGTNSCVPSPAASGDPATQPSMIIAWGNGRKDLDGWAYDSINPLCGTVASIDLPIDLLISRPATNGQFVIGTRLINVSTPSLPLFSVT
ncbi:MAG: hypothetical protein ABF623_14680 [Gluconobacter cerinus]|uniref:hypothetical protein n=1 Tax=Gluconobacter cerinus TaxID=38307 RepID=UPI0039EB1FF6